MKLPILFTTTQLAAHFGVEPWQVRRVIDSLDHVLVRAGHYRLVPAEQLGVVEAEMQRRGYVKTEQAEAAHA
jgi:hypothetical protein